MSWIKRFASSSIGKKQIVAVTGLGLVGFVIAHLAGNLLALLPDGEKAFNSYSHALISNPLIYVAEAGLLALFLVHIGLAIKLTLENRAARGPVRYAMIKSRGKPSRRSFASQTMILSGALLLVFTVLHLLTFKFGQHYETTVDGVVVRDLHRLVLEVFRSPGYVAWYVVCMIVLGLHLHHAIASVFETFGIDHPRWTPLINAGSKVVAWAIALGFIAIPVAIFLRGPKA